MGIGVIEFVLVHIGICCVFGVFCCVWYWREKRASSSRRRRSEQAAERFLETLAQSVPASAAASRVSSEPAIYEAPAIPFLAVQPDWSLVLAVLDREAYSDRSPYTPPATQQRSAASDTTATPPQSTQYSEPLSSSNVVYVPPPQPQYIPPDRPARYPIQHADLSQPSIPAPQASSSASGRLRRFGLLRMQSFRRADLEGIPRSLIWSIVSVEPKYCPWAWPSPHTLARSGSSTRLTAPSRSFRTLYGALGLLRGNSSTTSRSAATHPFHEDSAAHTYLAPSPSHSSRASMLGWRAPFLSGANGEMAFSMHEEAGTQEGATGPAVSAGLTGRVRGDTGSGSYPAAPSHSRSMWLRPPEAAAADSLQAALTSPWPPGSGRGMSLGHAIQLLELQVQRSIPEAGHPGADAVYGAQ